MEGDLSLTYSDGDSGGGLIHSPTTACVDDRAGNLVVSRMGIGYSICHGGDATHNHIPAGAVSHKNRALMAVPTCNYIN